MKRWFAKLLALLLTAVALPLAAQDLAQYEKRVTVKTLPNGLTVVLWRRNVGVRTVRLGFHRSQKWCVSE